MDSETTIKQITVSDWQQLQQELADLRERVAGLEQNQQARQESGEDECECGTAISWLISFFGPDYHQSHIKDCTSCGNPTLHVNEDAERCVNPECRHRGGIDAEGNVYRDEQIVSNDGKSVDQLRDEYFANGS